MNFWDKEFPGDIIQVDYDKLTENPELKTKELINELGLNWEEQCLFPQNNIGFTKTASKVQVRKKIYKNSSKEWEKYQSFIKDKVVLLKNL